MDWNAELYENKHDFVAEYGKDLLSNVPENPGLSILDLGCGTGTLTHALLEKSPFVTGMDASPEMIAKARQLYPGMDFRVMDACRMPWNGWFDIVFFQRRLSLDTGPGGPSESRLPRPEAARQADL